MKLSGLVRHCTADRAMAARRRQATAVTASGFEVVDEQLALVAVLALPHGYGRDVIRDRAAVNPPESAHRRLNDPQNCHSATDDARLEVTQFCHVTRPFGPLPAVHRTPGRDALNRTSRSATAALPFAGRGRKSRRSRRLDCWIADNLSRRRSLLVCEMFLKVTRYGDGWHLTGGGSV